MIAVRTCSTPAPGEASPIFTCCNPPDEYQALYYHRTNSSNPAKSHWRLTAADECHTFCESRDYGWTDATGTYWYFSFDGQPVGTREEVLAQYPAPQNLTDPWHGYPISAAPKAIMKRSVPLSVIDLWSASPGMPKYLENRLRKRQL
jgi:hypothetical protein